MAVHTISLSLLQLHDQHPPVSVTLFSWSPLNVREVCGELSVFTSKYVVRSILYNRSEVVPVLHVLSECPRRDC